MFSRARTKTWVHICIINFENGSAHPYPKSIKATILKENVLSAKYISSRSKYICPFQVKRITKSRVGTSKKTGLKCGPHVVARKPDFAASEKQRRRPNCHSHRLISAFVFLIISKLASGKSSTS